MSNIYDRTPVPQAATIEIGTECPRKCEGCAFNETKLQALSQEEIAQAIETLSKFWNAIAKAEDHQLIGARIVELIGGAGIFNKMSEEDIRAILDVARANKLFQFAVMCDAELDEKAIRQLFKTAAELEGEEATKMKTIVALSVDSLPSERTEMQRQEKANASWEMLNKRGEYIQDPDTQNFRVFTTISNKNLSEIPEIAKRVLESGNLLFIAPLTIHSEEALAKTGVEGRLIMGTDTNVLLDETNREEMEGVVATLRELKAKYPATFLCGEENFENMLAACKPVVDAFRGNCRERCAFVTKDGEELVATPNFRVMKRPGKEEMTLGICTGMVGPTDEEGNYANTALARLGEIAEGQSTVVDLYAALTADLAKMQCPGCNYRTSIGIRKGEGLK